MEAYRNIQDYKLREGRKRKRSQRNKNDKRPEELINRAKFSENLTLVFFGVS